MKQGINRSVWAYGALLLITLLASCQQPGEALTDRKKRENDAQLQEYITKNNLKPDISTSGIYVIKAPSSLTTTAAREGDQVQYTYVARRLDGLVLDSTLTTGQNDAIIVGSNGQVFPITTKSEYQGIGLYAGVSFLGAGDQALLLVPYYYNTGRIGTLALPSYEPIRYDVKIRSVRTEEQQIVDYIAANKINVTTKTDDGLRVSLTQSRPDSVAATTGKTVTINYTGKRLNGTIFDSNTAGTYKVTLGAKQVVTGFENGLTGLRVGEKATLIFPSAIGYSTQGSGYSQTTGTYTIPPYAPLVFEVEIKKVE